jgi:hypothetical protein
MLAEAEFCISRDGTFKGAPASRAPHLDVVVSRVMGNVTMDEPFSDLTRRPYHVVSLTRSNIHRIGKLAR